MQSRRQDTGGLPHERTTCTRQNGHRVHCEGSNETNDGAHERRLEQTRETGTILRPIPQTYELVPVPGSIRQCRGMHRLRLGRCVEANEDRRLAGAFTENSTCLNSGARRRPQLLWVQQTQNWVQQCRRVNKFSGSCRCGRTQARNPGTILNHPTHGTGKGETPEHELVVGPRERNIM